MGRIAQLRRRAIRAARMERLSRRAKRWPRVRHWRQVRVAAKRALARARRPRVFHSSMLGGHPGNISRACKRLIVRGVDAGLVVTSTTDGRHAPGSHHYGGDAVDFGLPGPEVGTEAGRRKLVAFQRSEARRPARHRELFGPDNAACVKDGRRVALAEGTPLEDQHDNHLHASPRW